MFRRSFVVLPLVLVGMVALYLALLPWPLTLRWREPGRTAFMELRLQEARARGEPLEIRQTWVPLDRISPHLRRAVLVAEDARFYDHQGIDWNALREEFRYRGDAEFSWTDPADLRALLAAFRYYRENRDKVRGRSTITQQLAKNLYLSADRSALRKAREFLLARRLERFLAKDRILELYLNTAEWGPGIFGAEAAAQHYYGRSAAALTQSQAAALAATLPHPLTSNPKLRPARMEWRQRLILERMGARSRVQTVPLEPPTPELPSLELPVVLPGTPVLPGAPEGAGVRPAAEGMGDAGEEGARETAPGEVRDVAPGLVPQAVPADTGGVAGEV